MRRSGRICLFIGIPLVLLGILSAVIFGVSLFRSFADVLEGREEIGITSGSVQVEADESYGLWVEVADDEPASVDSCELAIPNEETKRLSGDSTMSTSYRGEDWVHLGNFSSSQAGSVDITCRGDIQSVAVTEPFQDGMRRILGFVGGILGFGLGSLLSIIGLVLALVGRSQERRFQSYPPVGFTPPPGPGRR